MSLGCMRVCVWGGGFPKPETSARRSRTGWTAGWQNLKVKFPYTLDFVSTHAGNRGADYVVTLSLALSSLSLSLSLALSFSLSRSLALCLSLALSLSRSLVLSLALFLFLVFSLSHTRALSLFLYLSIYLYIRGLSALRGRLSAVGRRTGLREAGREGGGGGGERGGEGETGEGRGKAHMNE